MIEERIKELEVKLAYQDDLVESLNQCVIELRGQLDALQQQVTLIHQQLNNAPGHDAPAHDPPPHY